MTKKGSQTRDRILVAALQEFSEKGPAGARINDIAQKAGVNKERIYSYFGSKDNLFQVVLAHTFENLRQQDNVLLKLTEEDIPELSQILLRHYMTVHTSDPDLWRMLAWENLCGACHMHVICNIDKRGYSYIENLYICGQKKGYFKQQVSFSTYITMLIGISFFYHSNRLTMSTTLQKDLSADKVKNVFIEEALLFLKP